MKVSSIAIKEIFYKNKNLTILFKSGSKYRYKDVPKKIYSDFVDSKSKGKYFLKKIRNSFMFDRVS